MTDDEILEAISGSPASHAIRKELRDSRPQEDATKQCPFCGIEINRNVWVCPNCKREARPSLAAATYRAERFNPGLAAVLSFFIPGLGQIYKGQYLDGFIKWPLAVVLGYLCVVIPGIYLHYCCIYDAYNANPDA